MKMKNVLMILIAFAVVFTMAGVVSAGVLDTEDQGQNIFVNYSVNDIYVVTIPSNVDFGQTLFSKQDVNATKVLINPDKKLIVNLTSRNFNAFERFCLNNTNSLIPYNITNEFSQNKIQLNAEETTVLTVTAGQQHPNYQTAVNGLGIGNVTALNFTTTNAYIGMANKSGLHQDVLTFKFRVI